MVHWALHWFPDQRWAQGGVRVRRGQRPSSCHSFRFSAESLRGGALCIQGLLQPLLHMQGLLSCLCSRYLQTPPYFPYNSFRSFWSLIRVFCLDSTFFLFIIWWNDLVLPCPLHHLFFFFYIQWPSQYQEWGGGGAERECRNNYSGGLTGNAMRADWPFLLAVFGMKRHSVNNCWANECTNLHQKEKTKHHQQSEEGVDQTDLPWAIGEGFFEAYGTLVRK